MRHRFASVEDARLLGVLNRQLILDEGHRNPMMIPELIYRMRHWLETDYRASIFEDDSAVTAYALYREEQDRVYLRQFFVKPQLRRAALAGNALTFLFPRSGRSICELR